MVDRVPINPIGCECPKVKKNECEKHYAKYGKGEKTNKYFKFLNVNPEGVSIRTGDCVIRAIAAAEGVPFEVAERECLEHLMKIGMHNYAYWHKDYLTTYYETMGFGTQGEMSRPTALEFAKSHPVGSYVLRVTSNHVTACINGIIHDTWDCTDKYVYRSWLIKSP